MTFGSSPAIQVICELFMIRSSSRTWHMEPRQRTPHLSESKQPAARNRHSLRSRKSYHLSSQWLKVDVLQNSDRWGVHLHLAQSPCPSCIISLPRSQAPHRRRVVRLLWHPARRRRACGAAQPLRCGSDASVAGSSLRWQNQRGNKKKGQKVVSTEICEKDL